MKEGLDYWITPILCKGIVGIAEKKINRDLLETLVESRVFQDRPTC